MQWQGVSGRLLSHKYAISSHHGSAITAEDMQAMMSIRNIPVYPG